MLLKHQLDIWVSKPRKSSHLAFSQPIKKLAISRDLKFQLADWLTCNQPRTILRYSNG